MRPARRPLLAALALAALTGTLGAAIGGVDVFGRALIALGLPSLAAPIMSQPGPALFASGSYPDAAEAFAASGSRYNEGVAAARAGDYAAALAAFDAAIAADPSDGAARANYDLVRQIFAGTRLIDMGLPLVEEKPGATVFAETGQGSGRASSTGAEATNTGTSLLPATLRSDGLRQAEKLFDAHHLAASERWLATLADEPGLFLKARLAARQEARIANGTALPPAEDPQ